MSGGAEELLEGVAGEWEGDRRGGDSAGGAVRTHSYCANRIRRTLEIRRSLRTKLK